MLGHVLRYTCAACVFVFCRLSQLYDTGRLSYTLPTHRATVYLIGIAVSFILRETKDKVSLNKVGSEHSSTIRQR